MTALWQRLKPLWDDEKRRVQLLAAAGMAGLLLLAVSEWLPAETAAAPPNAAEAQEADYAAQLEQQMAELLGTVEGAGTVRVMVPVSPRDITGYAADTESRADGSAASTPVLVSGNTAGLVETVYAPEVLGVAVVCTGGDDPAVQASITALVQALTDVGTHHITVAKIAADKQEAR